MQIGIGLPSSIPDVSPSLVLDWARKAEAGPFSSVGVIDRLVYPNYEPMVTLGAVAAVTERVRLFTVILIATLRPAGIFAKEAASVDLLSEGRLTLGLAVGRRPDDFKGTPAEMRGRGKRFEGQLEVMRKAWAGEPLAEDVGPIGPLPAQNGGPPVLVGGTVAQALERAGRLGDGYIAGAGRTAAAIAEHYETVTAAWQSAGKTGRPMLASIRYYALGPDALERGAPYVQHYYGNPGGGADAAVQAILTTPQAVKDLMADYASVGMDDLILLPSIPEMDQLDRLAQLVG